MFEPQFLPKTDENYESDTYTVTANCVFCGTTTTAQVPCPAVFQWRQGAFAQVAFPNLTPVERDALFITGMCDPCSTFPGEDD